jgi:hypothetical protein
MESLPDDCQILEETYLSEPSTTIENVYIPPYFIISFGCQVFEYIDIPEAA